MLGVDPLPPPGAKREPAAGEKTGPEEGDKTGNDTTAEPDAKRARVQGTQE